MTYADWVKENFVGWCTGLYLVSHAMLRSEGSARPRAACGNWPSRTYTMLDVIPERDAYHRPCERCVAVLAARQRRMDGAAA